jgi:uncharacterized membrane protein (DUF2068 family)
MRHNSTSFRAVALFELAKGILVLIAAGALLEHLHTGAQQAAEELVRHFHMNPASKYPRIFIEAASNLTNAHLLALAFGALVYAGIRFAEAYGLWRGMNWAWGFGLISAGLYIPYELVSLTREVTWAGVVVITVNVLILAVLWRARAR